MLGLLCRLFRKRPEPPAIDESHIAAKYREHDRNIARQREAIKKVEYVEDAIRRRISTGNWSADLLRGAYNPTDSRDDTGDES